MLLALLAGCTPVAAPTGRTIELTPCQLSAPGLPTRLLAECGQLVVFEDRAAGTGRQIELNIAVVPATTRNPAPDPLFFLTGGPGQAATESYLQLRSAFERINEKRDIVLVDQRGTGQSNPLRCPEPDEEADPFTHDETQSLALLEACRDQLDADPRLYTTALAMDDLDDVRRALGYDQINLYGLSYGTRAALTYLRQYPDRVRAVILDGVVPPELALGLNVPRDAQRALDLIFDRCADDEDCRTTFPDLRDDFAFVLASLEREPAELTLPHPITAEPTEMVFTRDMFAAGVRLYSYSPETAALLPLLIHNARATGDLRLLAAQSLFVGKQLADSISAGMNMSVLCAEDVPFFTPEEVARGGAGTYLGSSPIEHMVDACAVWPRGEIPADAKEPVRSQVPVLLLSGEADPVTPPANADLIARALPNSLHIVVPAQGHNVVFRGCVPRLATTFVEQGSVAELETDCVQNIRPWPFFVNFGGPRP